MPTLLILYLLHSRTAMSPFTVSREFTCEKEIQASYEDVLRFIQDPFKLCIQNPLITSVVKDETDPQLYTITDRLSIVGPLTTSTTYRAKIVSIEGGVTTETEAALGTRLRSRFVVERGLTNDTCVLKEVTSVEVRGKTPYTLVGNRDN